MDRVIVLMSTYNGEKYLRTQIDSILAQENVIVELLVRDDGSSDQTQSILEEYRKHGNLKWYGGANLKPAGSFMDLIQKAGKAEYYALSDQDDYWLPGKLSRAVEQIKSIKEGQPVLYCSTTTLTDENLNVIDDKRSKNELFTVKQALIGSGAAGCTMCFNQELMELIRKPHPDSRLMHDNWIYKLCAVVDGTILKDSKSYIMYRQHGGNAIGGLAQNNHPYRRHFQSIKQEKRYRSEGIAALFEAYKDDMPNENQLITGQLAYYRKGFRRWKILFDKGYNTGNRRNDILFKVAIVFGLF